MKAGTLKQFLLKKYPTSDYFDCPVPKHHWEVIQEYADDYARIQIEKDRERIKANINFNDDGIKQAMEKVIDNTHINLD
mgnify:FL=1